MPHWTRPAMLYLTISAQYSIWYFAALTFITIAAVAIAITVRRPAASTRAVQ
jgi:hypothetical protein